MQTIRVKTTSAKYDVMAGSGMIGSLASRIERVVGRLPRRVFVLTSAPVWGLWGQAMQRSFREAPVALFLESGEKHKTLASVEGLLRQMAQAGGDRGSLLIALGGGMHHEEMHGGPHHDAPHHDAPHHDAPHHDAPHHDAPHHDDHHR